MPKDSLTPKISARICKHMNDDHPEALITFAKRYGGIVNPKKAKMIDLTSLTMKLDVDGKTIEIPFDHKITDSEDAHRSLVAMLRRGKEES